MKKFVFGLIATVMFSFVGSAQDVKVQSKANYTYDLYSSIDLSNQDLNNTSYAPESLKPKNGWYYAGVDGGGAWGWGSAGSALGPLGTSAGIVLGGLCTTTWAYYWENKAAPNPVTSPKDSFASSFTNEDERCGYLHNKFAVEFINLNQTTFKTPTEFMGKFYEPLCKMVSSEYKINIEDLKKAFPKEDLELNLDNYSNLASYTDDEKTIIQMGVIVENQGHNSKCSDYYVKVMQSLYTASESLDFKIVDFVANEIEFVNGSIDFSNDEKALLKGSLNVLKYSYALWIVN